VNDIKPTSGKLRTLWELTRGHRLRYLLAVIATLGSIYFMYQVPLVIGGTIDLLYPKGHTPGRITYAHRLLAQWGGRDKLASTLVLVVLALVAARALSGYLLYLRGRWSAVAAESIARRLRETLYDHLQRLPARYHDKAETGDLVQRCTSDVDTIRMFLGTQVVEIGRAAVLLGMGLPFLLYLSPWMGLLSMAMIPPIIAFGAVFFSQVRQTFKAADEAEGRMTSRLQENLSGIRVVRAFARQEYEIQRFAQANAEYRRRSYTLMRLLSFYWPISDALCFAQQGLVLFAGAWYVSRGRLSTGDLFAYIMYVNLFLWPVRNVGRILADMGKTVVSLGREGEILSQKIEVELEHANAETAPPGAAAPRGKGEIVIGNLSFDHGPEIPVLRDVSLRIKPGSTLAILGPAGSGKSTLINLLLRLYDYETGSIELDGTELRALPRRFVRGQIGSVLQEPFIYSKSLRENIKLAHSEAEEEEIVEAASAAAIHDSIAAFEDGYDTLVGERGVTLSGGQRQRVALARVLLKNPPVLVLDDAFSAVDTHTERIILHALRQRHGRRTTIVIAHRLSTLMHADHIVVLDEGRITQSGTHDSLIAQEGMYRRLWQIQTSLADDLAAELAANGAKAK
jgi:ATP-binding cassette, subfamily B, bacterial